MDLKTAIRETPEAIRRWLGSEDIADAVEKLNRERGLNGEEEGIIPYLVLRLAVKDLLPREFVAELSDFLGIDAQTAKEISEQIKDKVLKQIKNPLFDWGVDIEAIRPETKVEMRYRPEKQTVYEEIKDKRRETDTLPAERAEAKPDTTGGPKPFVIDLSEKSSSAPQIEPRLTTPFILRKEERPVPIAEKGEAKISIPIVQQREKGAVSFRVELKESEDKKGQVYTGRTEPPKDRVVHYVGPKTNLFPQSTPPQPIQPPSRLRSPQIQEEPPIEEIIDLSSFRRVQKPRQEQEESGPKIKGNTINLSE